MSVSYSQGGNADLAAIAAGGAPFAERLKTFAAAAKEAQDAAKLLAETKAEAAKVVAEAASIRDVANEQLAKNKALAKQLAAETAAAIKLQAALTAKLDAVNKIMAR
jgi:hypothetical protein